LELDLDQHKNTLFGSRRQIALAAVRLLEKGTLIGKASARREGDLKRPLPLAQAICPRRWRGVFGWHERRGDTAGSKFQTSVSSAACRLARPPLRNKTQEITSFLPDGVPEIRASAGNKIILRLLIGIK
jgi:hypothetical protein